MDNTSLKHSMVNRDALTNEFCSLFNYGELFPGLVNCGPSIVPDSDWTIERPETCTIENHIITWNRVLGDSFIRLSKPPGFAAGQSWTLDYVVIENDGVTGSNIFVSSASSVLSGNVLTSSIGDQRIIDPSTDDNVYLFRWTPDALFNNKTLQIKNVRIYETPVGGGAQLPS